MKYTEQDFREALENIGLSRGGPIRIGYLAATTTGPARTAEGKRVWVRVGTVADDLVWMRAEAIEEASRELADEVPMPRVPDAFTWEKHDLDEGVTRRARAHVFEYVEGVPVSPEPVIRQAPEGTDTAELPAFSLVRPPTAERVRDVFGISSRMCSLENRGGWRSCSPPRTSGPRPRTVSTRARRGRQYQKAPVWISELTCAGVRSTVLCAGAVGLTAGAVPQCGMGEHVVGDLSLPTHENLRSPAQQSWWP